MMRRRIAILCVLVPLVMIAESAHEKEVMTWREGRANRLKTEEGWLSLAGLFWLKEGDNTFGKDPKNAIALPDGPAKAGVFHLSKGKVTVTMDGKTREVPHDTADKVTVGRLRLFVIQRGDRYGIRLKDPETEARRNFHGLDYFPISDKYRVTAKFVAQPKKIPVLNVIGITEDSDCPGYVEFTLNGKQLKLYPIIEEPGDKQLFYIFRDQTAGKETYGAGRFLYSDMPENGKVVLDFNKAYNPPCVFTPYATCPLPPKDNHLAVRIEAGEKNYGH